MVELKYCPFCGGKDVHIVNSFPHYIYCLDCGINVRLSGKPWEKDIPELAKAWNTRTPKERGGE